MIEKFKTLYTKINSSSIYSYLFITFYSITVAALIGYAIFFDEFGIKLYMSSRIQLVELFHSHLIGTSPVTLIEGNFHGQVIYIFLAYFMKFINISNGETIFNIIQYIFYIALFFIFSLETYTITKSLKKVFISIIILFFFTSQLLYLKTDTAWASFIVVILSMPVIVHLLDHDYFSKSDMYWSFYLTIILAFFNLPRLQSSFSMMLIFVYVIIKKIIFLFQSKKRVNSFFY